MYNFYYFTVLFLNMTHFKSFCGYYDVTGQFIRCLVKKDHQK